MSVSLSNQVWYWGNEDEYEINKALEHCLDGTFIVRDNSNRVDYTLHVVYRGIAKKLLLFSRNDSAGLSLDNMCFGSVVSLIEHFSHVSLAVHNKSINVRLTNPLSKHEFLDDSDGFNKDDETFTIYVDLYMKSDILSKLGEECTKELQLAQEEAQSASYRATAQHRVIEIWQEQVKARDMAVKHFERVDTEYVNGNFDEQETRLAEANAELERISGIVTEKQTKVREIVLKREEIEKKKRKLFRHMDWYERLLVIEGIDNATVVKCIQPFKQDLGLRLLIQGIKEMWFVGILDKPCAQELLESRENGTYLVRVNTKKEYVLGVVDKRKVRHIIIQHSRNMENFWLQSNRRFPSVVKLIDHYKIHSLGDSDPNYSTRLENPVYF